MKIRTYIIVFMTVLAGSFFMASCLNEENKIPDNCYDGVLNNGENPGLITVDGVILVDCGGPNCSPCDHCVNGVMDEGETWRDCGGECAACQPCSNGILDNGEVAIDCGGDCGGCNLLCEDGLLNGFEDDIDCDNQADVLQSGCDFCPTCIDNIYNGDETGIDCGGPDCGPCCSTGNCGNGIQDGLEFYIDCGGNTCEDCLDTLVWKIGSTNLYSPRILITVAEGVNTLTFSDCAALEVGETPFQVGSLSIQITKPPTGWPLNTPLEFPPLDPAEYTIVYIDEIGEPYTSSNLDGSGKITMTRVASIVVPDDEFDGCHKPAGTYKFYRGSFSGTLYSSDPTLPSINCSQGVFQVTFFTPL